MTCASDSIQDFDKIKCSLRELDEYSCMESEKKRFGRYHRSCFWDVPKKNWVVGVKIDLDFSELEGADLTTEEITKACLAHLNTPPPRRKYAKKAPTPPYGILEYYKANIVQEGTKKSISALVVTDKRKNRMFWGKGKNVG